jgi:nitrate reductase NapAB chaperone NapD
MATQIYDVHYIDLLDGRIVKASPLKIKYLREFMNAFELVKYAQDDDQAMLLLTGAAFAAMGQYCPDIKTIEQFEDVVNMPLVYHIIDIAAGIKIDESNPEEDKKAAPLNEQATNSENSNNWENLDLAKLESELFLIGSWKNYEDLEEHVSMAELLATLSQKRELDYNEKKFLAAIEGVDLDKESGNDTQNAWEEMKARVFSKGKAADSNDILALQGQNAVSAGFGIGMGLDYEDLG